MMQGVADGVIAASIVALIGVGFAIIYRVHHFFHFSYAGLYTLGAYIAYFLHAALGFPIFVAAVLSILATACLGGLLEVTVFRRLRSRRSSALVLLLCSLGVFIVAENLVALIYDQNAKTLREGPATVLTLMGLRLSYFQISIIGASGLALLGIWLLLNRTDFGLSLRAVSCDAELSSILGVDTRRILTVVFFLGSGLAALAGILVGLDTYLVPAMGFRGLLLGVTAVILGGEGSILGILLASLLIGWIQHLGVAIIPARWQDSLVFSFLILVLLVRPHGLFAKARR